MNHAVVSPPKIKTLAIVFIALALLRILCAWWLPVVTDEAYYFRWSQYPDLGYFDHPPVVAWLGLLGVALKGGVFWYRLGGLLLHLLLFPLFISLCKKAGLKTSEQLISAALFMFFNIFGFALGVITTPDIPLFFAWTLALHEAAAALSDNPKRWLTAGAATALGLWGKYTMLLMGPIFLFALIRKKRALLSPWPYLGGVVCLLLFLPHLYWNMHNEWISFGFQMAHGIKGSHRIEFATNTDLPEPLAPRLDSPEYRLSQYFMTGEEPVHKPESRLQKLERRLSHFVIGQSMVWGALVVPLILTGIRRKKRGEPVFRAAYFLGEAHPPVRDLLLAATVTPLLIFGVVNLFEGVEGNWPALYTASGAIFCASYLERCRRSTFWLAGVNIAVIFGAIGLAQVSLPTKNFHKNRILWETHGYAELTKAIKDLEGPQFADTYQITSMVSFYDPNLKIQQWPGITRHSELTRRKELGFYDLQALAQSEKFWLVTREPLPPRLAGFAAAELTEIKDCLRQGLIFTKARPWGVSPAYSSPCKDAVHNWYLVHYVRQ